MEMALGLSKFQKIMFWKIWIEKSMRVFRHHASSANLVIAKFKEDAKMWSTAGAKLLSIVISGVQ
jgi:hypothetical protein